MMTAEPDSRPRCGWTSDDVLMLRYHDTEWGVPVHDDRRWFEFLVLNAFQAGLSWRTVLNKRDAFRKAFLGFDPGKVARMSTARIEAAANNPAIIRNRLKIGAAIKNARVFLGLQEQHGSFNAFIWSFTQGRVIHNQWRTLSEIPAATPLSDTVSRALKQAGFAFAGTTICYATLQAAGVVNDHLLQCFRHHELRELSQF
jgi:DNA-3-methyladenine glycosylase I